jgi:hypothetical protein
MVTATLQAVAQPGRMGNLRNLPGAMGRPGGGGMSQGKADSLQHRTGLEDSISIRFRMLNASRFAFF